MRAAQTQLIPMQEMTPGMIAEVRNSVITSTVALASKEIGLPPDALIVRDILPNTDLTWKFSTTSSATTGESWERNMTAVAIGYQTVATGNMATQRFVAIFGLRDGRVTSGPTGASTLVSGLYSNATHAIGDYLILNTTSLVKFEVGGGARAIWDSSSMLPYMDKVAFCPSAVVIPQNAAFTIYIYQIGTEGNNVTVAELAAFIQPIGVTVEPRGKLVTA